MILGIVGSEAAKFTLETKEQAQNTIYALLDTYEPEIVVSGACHLGGIDYWAMDGAEFLGVPTKAYPPKTKNWDGFKARNIEIAEASDKVICITVRELPPGFNEGGWERYCYHCKTDSHIKSGGCWTVKYAREKLGKPGEIIVV